MKFLRNIKNRHLIGLRMGFFYLRNREKNFCEKILHSPVPTSNLAETRAPSLT